MTIGIIKVMTTAEDPQLDLIDHLRTPEEEEEVVDAVMAKDVVLVVDLANVLNATKKVTWQESVLTKLTMTDQEEEEPAAVEPEVAEDASNVERKDTWPENVLIKILVVSVTEAEVEEEVEAEILEMMVQAGPASSVVKKVTLQENALINLKLVKDLTRDKEEMMKEDHTGDTMMMEVMEPGTANLTTETLDGMEGLKAAPTSNGDHQEVNGTINHQQVTKEAQILGLLPRLKTQTRVLVEVGNKQSECVASQIKIYIVFLLIETNFLIAINHDLPCFF